MVTCIIKYLHLPAADAFRCTNLECTRFEAGLDITFDLRTRDFPFLEKRYHVVSGEINIIHLVIKKPPQTPFVLFEALWALIYDPNVSLKLKIYSRVNMA